MGALFTGGIIACGLTVAGEQTGSTTTIPTSDASASANGDADPGTSVCTNTATDPLNCGRCGHSCLGGNCVEGACQPFVFIGALKSPIGVAVDSQKLYWSASGGIFSVPLATGAPQTPEVVDAGNATTYLVVENNDVFWTRNIGALGSINARTLPNGDVRNLFPFQDHVSGIAKVGPTIYFTRQWIDSLAKTLPDGGTEIITGSLSFPETVATDGTMLYIAAPGGYIFSVGLEGGKATTLAGPLLGEAPCGIAVSGDTLFITLRDTGRVVSMPKTGGPLTELAYQQPKPHGIAVDDKAIYWANTVAGSIMRLAR